MTTLYQSETTPVAVAELPAALRAALQGWAERHQLDLTGVRAWRTHSVNPLAQGLLGRLLGRRSNPVDPDAEHDSVLVLHATHLMVGTSGERRGVAVLGLPLLQASVTRGIGLALPLPSAPTDDGITIEGFPGHQGRPGTYFFGLGGAGADECFAAVEAALRACKR